jgi:uncharacterized SAM-binding protein YcdF (DUF218 family)
MFIIKKVVTAFLLPPGLIVLILAITGVWMVLKKNRFPGGVLLTVAGLVWFLALAPVSDILYKDLESPYTIPTNIDGDVIIVLGGGVNGTAPDLTGTGAPSGESCERLLTAGRLQKRLKIPVITTGGSVFREGDSEAVIVKRFLVDLGVPEAMIRVEGNSRDTIENARMASRICSTFGYRTPVLVTSAFHMRRAIFSFRQVGLDVLPVPAGFRSKPGSPFRWTDLLPRDYRDVSHALKEYLGILYYRLAHG